MSKFSKALATLLVLFAISGLVVVIEAQESGAGAPTTSADNELATTAATQLQEIRKSLAIADGNKTKAADMLGISRFTLQRKMDKYGLA